MPQLSLYIDEATMGTLQASARAGGVSMSRYAADLIRERERRGGWPQGYWESVYGCLGDEVGLSVADDDLRPDRDDACDWFEDGAR